MKTLITLLLLAFITGCQSVEFFDEETQKEAILDVDSKIGDSTYLIPINRIISNDLIKQQVEELVSQFKVSDEDIKAYNWEYSEESIIPYEGGISTHEAVVQLYMQNFYKKEN